MPKIRKTSRKIVNRHSRKRSHKSSRKPVRKHSRRDGRKWVKHDILTRFKSSDYKQGVIVNDKNSKGIYEDPITFKEIKEGDEVVCLGNERLYRCYTLDTIQEQIKHKNLVDPFTRKPIDENIILSLSSRGFSPLEYELIFENEGKAIMINKDFNKNPKVIFNEENNKKFEAEGVQRIFFGTDFNQSLGGVNFPKGIIQISFGDRFNKPIDDVKWPDDLKSIQFGEDFNQSIDKTGLFSSVKLPDAVEVIHFGKNFNKSVADVKWPSKLLTLMFPSGYSDSSIRYVPSKSNVRFIFVGNSAVYSEYDSY